jgi:hypothetical protein
MDFRQALCAQYDGPNLWLSPDPQHQRQAKQICAKCPVLMDCAIRVRELDPRPTCGVWATQTIGGYLE